MFDMQKSEVVARVLGEDSIECTIVSPRGKRLKLSGNVTDDEPEFETGGLGNNRALVNNAWAFAKARYAAVNLPDQDQQKNAEKRAKKHQNVAEWIADVADDLTSEKKHGWCSACFGQHDHSKANRPLGQLPAYVCDGCGSPTLPCVPGCKNMAARGQGAIQIPQYCAEHRHEIPGFEKADLKMGALGDYVEFLKFDKANLSRATKLVGLGLAGIALGAPAALVAAPAIGGAVGALLGGYTGAAATSFGLALVGGGSLAAGGLGVAGGTLVITGLGAALGGALGASVTNAYVREDRSFHIEMLQGGQGVPVIVCNGFLSESGKGWGEWKDIISARYANSPVYRVHWGAKELKHLGFLGAGGAARIVVGAALKEAAMKAAKIAAKRLGPLGPALFAVDLAKNPWHVAKNRAEKTGAILADLLARTNEEAYVLVGHSLGARAMVVAAQTLGTKPDGPRVQAIHLLGAAIGARSDWHTLTGAVNEAVYNYHSTKDSVLKLAYPFAERGQTAAGLTGFTPTADRLKNIDVSAQVGSHFDYHKNVSLNSSPPL